MKNKIIVLFIFAFAFHVQTVFSQGCEDEAATSTSANAEDKPVTIRLFGYLQPEYDYTFSDPAVSTFGFRRARLGVTGKVLKDFSYYFMLEASPFIGGVGSAYLMDAFITYEKYNWARVSVGSFKQPFSLEVATPCFALTTIDRSIVADQLVAPQRDYGLMLLGGNKFTKFRYAVALMNGSGLNQKDNNNKKDFVGRVTYKLFDFLAVGGSFRYGYPINEDEDRTTFGGEFLINHKKLAVQGEYIYDEGDFNRAAGGGCGSTPVDLGEKRDGAYIMLTYDLPHNLQPVFKYEYFDPNIDVKKIGYMEMMTVGLNYFHNDYIRIQLNYQAHIETDINIDNDKFLAQIQVRF